MKGLTPQQLIDITAFIQKHHTFAYVREENRIKGNLGYSIKYIDACYDSRGGDYWAITFRGFGSLTFTTNSFGLFNQKPGGFHFGNLYDWIMAFLKYEWTAEGKEYEFMWQKNEGRLVNNFPNGSIEKEWSDIDMMNAYCADLEDGATTEDMDSACKWIINYRNAKATIQLTP